MKSALILLALLCFASLPGFSATLEITIKDAKGAAVEDAVVWAMPKPGPAPARKLGAAVGQKDKTFIPLVTVVQTGTAVQFPNQDPIRHHVYSFSIVFDKPGEVVLGCNIHDHMHAYIYVVDTPYFAKTGTEGRAHLESVPAGDYELLMWHFAQAAPVAPQALRLRGEESTPAGFTVTLAPIPPRIPAK